MQSVHDVKQTLPLPSQDHEFPKSSEREKQINETTRDPPERPLQLVRPDATHKKLELVQENIQVNDLFFLDESHLL